MTPIFDFSGVVADPGDVAAQNYNQRSIYVDGDLGVAYTSDKFNIQAAIPNLKSAFFASDAESLNIDRATFYTAVSYKITLTKTDNDLMLEPKLAFRGVKGVSITFSIWAPTLLYLHTTPTSAPYTIPTKASALAPVSR